MHDIASSRFADRIVAGFSAVTGLGFVGWAVSVVSMDDVGTFVFSLFLLAWVAAPYIVLAACAVRVSSSWVSRTILVLAVCGSAAFGMWAFDFVDEDAQGDLVLLLGPAYQMGGVVCIVGLVVIVEFTKRRRTT